MSPQTIMQGLLQEVPLLQLDTEIDAAVERIIATEVPALPVIDDRGSFAGVFGEREFMAALFPGYVSELKSAAFVRASLDDAIERRASCRTEPVGRYAHTEHVEVNHDASDVQIAETFLHHRVLIVPVCDTNSHVIGIVTRNAFFRALAQRLLDSR